MPVRSASYSCGAQLTMQLPPSPWPSNTKHGLLELPLHSMSGAYHGARLVPSSAPAPARQGGGTIWFDAHPDMLVPHGGCLVPLGWVCGWALREAERWGVFLFSISYLR